MAKRISRRTFIGTTGAAGAGFWITGRQLGYGQERSPNAKVNMGCIGVGGRGEGNVDGVKGENIVALCDPDEVRLGAQAKKYPNAKTYVDYRKMLEEVKEIEAVTVATPDHHHAPASAMAVKMGKHVYVEKPMTHSIYEARTLTELAAKHKVQTQMGNQGHSSGGRRRLVEFLQQGGIGKVTEVHAWTNRPIWPQAVDRPPKAMDVPATFHWDIWIGPAPERPYHKAYAPFAWRGWWDFGTGALGDMACHIMDAAFWGLGLKYPTAVEAEGAPLHPESGPAWMTVKLDFPARGDKPALKYTWYDGKKKGPDGKDVPNLPPEELAAPIEFYKDKAKEKLALTNGNIIVGDKGTVVVLDEQTGNWKAVIDGKVLDKSELKIEKTLPDSPGHHEEWIRAIKGGPAALGNWGYSGPFTETVLIGIVAFRANKGKLQWDGESMKAQGCPEADPFIKREYRKGWTL